MNHKTTRISVAAAIFLVSAVVGLSPAQAADSDTSLASDPSVLTATTQTIVVGRNDLVVNVNGQVISAMPFRIRLIGQASPYAYSLDITRPAQYGDTWTGLSLGRPADNDDRSLSRIGVRDPEIANIIARGDRDASQPVLYPQDDLELAARQVAIWSYVNELPLVAQVVPNAELLARAKQLAAGAQANLRAQLQPAHYSIGVFVRETTGNTVNLAITLGTDQNSSLTDPANIALSFDGSPCADEPGTPGADPQHPLCTVRTRALTKLGLNGDGTFGIDSHTDYSAGTHSTQVAEVELARNTKVLSLSANWVNVTSEPGVIMAGDGSAPPLATAEAATLNFTTTTQLDPQTYTGPTQLLSKAGTSALTHVPNWAVLLVLIAALYFVARVGRGADKLFVAAWHKIWHTAPPVTTAPTTVVAEAPTEQAAIDAGVRALALPPTSTVNVEVVQVAAPSQPGQPAVAAKVRLTVV